MMGSEPHSMTLFKTSYFCLAIALCVALTYAATSSISLVKASFKLNIVRDGEKIHQLWLTAERDEASQTASPEGFQVSNGNSISVQASFEGAGGGPAFVRQLFLRFVNTRTKQDNLFLVKRKGRDMRADVVLEREVKSDAEFWVKDDSYAVELIMGDLHMKESTTWTITENMRFAEDAAPMFSRPERGVFDFDVSVKKYLLPEFFSPVPVPEKRASLPAIVMALISVLLPLPVLFIVWTKLGVFPLEFPKERSQQLYIFGFESCLLGHLVALVMFWVKWNIVTTWKVVGALMIPTMIFGRNVLSADKKR